MKVKNSYKVPVSLNQSYLDVEIALVGKNGNGLRPMPIKIIFFWIAGIFIGGAISFNTFIKEAGYKYSFIFMILWLLFLFLLGSYDGTKRMGINLILPLFEYLDKSNRLIKMRSTDYVEPARKIFPIIDDGIEKSGMIHWADGSVGLGFSVVGSASMLLFESDKNNILNRVAKFYEKMDIESEIIYDTTKEPQVVDYQLKNLNERWNDREIIDCQGLNSLFIQQKNILEHDVGGRFNSIHQYMFVKTENEEVLQRFMNMFTYEADRSSYMFKNVRLLRRNELIEYFRKFYSGGNR